MHRSVLLDPSPAAMPAVLASDDEVAVAYWAAASWAAWISLSKNDPDVVADLPSAVRLARLAYEQRPDHGHGALASLMGTLEAARPGGSLAQAQQYFDHALAIAGPDDPSVLLAMAEAVAQPAGDRERFEQLLRRALASDQRRPELAAQVMRERARWLLQSLDELF
jgi:tetratricopeptide (TPR) repeat protein